MTDVQSISHGEQSVTKTLSHNDEIVKKSILIEDGSPARYRLQITTEDPDESKSYRKKIFGERDPEKSHKTILLVGETGTGKTTLINAMINYMCGVKREDNIWFEIQDDQSKETSAHSQTSIITVYGVYIPESSHDLTIIDTPGYGDTRGIESDREIAKSLLNLCKSDDLVDEIDAVCFVIKADQNRLSDRQKYIIDAVQSLFGSDVAENIVLLLTHSDGFPPKNALTAIKEAEVKCAVDDKKQLIYFLFNNCQSETFKEEYETIRKQSWDLSYKGMREFFKFIDQIKLKTLKIMKAVLQKRHEFELKISSLQACVQNIEQKKKELGNSETSLHKLKEETHPIPTKDVEVSYKEKVDTASAKKAMCCTVCEENCHYPGCSWICDIKGCQVMKSNQCTVCRNKCHYSKHVKEAKIYEEKTKTEKRIDEDLKKKHEDKITFALSSKDTLEKELQELEKEKLMKVMDAYHCVETLGIIALNADSFTILEHIDFLIKKLKEINDPEKVEALENIKKTAGQKKHKSNATYNK
ncbi:uncharacterized protein LOC130429837 [Triplophysa dalaica]|uniref:uncharacterized protein LOC130429837 n=1 Tax=Triplophysa dalaica TaxID=1582913 RepID=UPI0024DF5223|nr:uncharacterized protein LOC130429837 [Triplophysa dalaica]